MIKAARYFFIVVAVLLLLIAMQFTLGTVSSPYAPCMPSADLPFETNLNDDADAKTVQVFMAFREGSYHIIGRQEIAGAHHVAKRYFSGQQTHLAVVFDADGRELQRQALRFRMVLPFDTFENETLRGGMAAQSNPSTSLRYSALGHDEVLKVYALPPDRRSSRDVYDYDPQHMEAVYAMALR